MNVTCKRLLSWLVVVTMVLSMVPVLDLSNFAVTTQAAENPAQGILNAIEALRSEFATAAATNATVSAICPVCGGEEAAEWTPLTGAANQMAPTTENPHPHYYLSNDVTFAGQGTNFGGRNDQSICLNLNGNNITANGKALDITNGNTINVMDSAETDGVVTGTADAYYGAAINVGNANAVCNIYGGTFKKESCNGSVVNIRNNGGTINMYAGTIDASEAVNDSWATTISLMTNGSVKSTFNLYGGLVKCGTLTKGGVQYRANIMLGYSNYSGATFNMEGGTVVGGTYSGAAGGGGATFAVVMGNTLKISGGTVYGGKFGTDTEGNSSGTLGANIFSLYNGAGNLEISGGTIVGGIYTRNAIDVKLSGAPQIVTSLKLENGETEKANVGFELSGISNSNLVNIDGLSASANIVVTGTKGKVFAATSDNAANVKECFSNTTANLDVLVNSNDQLYIGDKVAEEGTFDPWNCVNNEAYCEACSKQQGQPVKATWTALKDGSTSTGLATGHYYLESNMTQQITRASGATVCLQLNGKNVTVKNKVFGTMNNAGTLNIMNTVGGTVAGWQSTYTGEVLDLRHNDAVVNIYGGTFVKHAEASTQGSIVYFHTGGKVNMYGGTIDGSGVKNTAHGSSVELRGEANKVATFKMFGGEIKGGASTGDGGNVIVGGGTTGTAVFEMHGGTVSGGIGRAGGNFYVNAGELKVYAGAVIMGGVAECLHTNGSTLANLGGGNILVHTSGKLYMEGGIVSGGQATLGRGGNILVREDGNGTVEIIGGKIYNGVASSDAQGHNVSVRSAGEYAATLTIGGTAEISGDIVTGTNVMTVLSGTPKIMKTGLEDAEGKDVTGNIGLNVTANSNLDITELAGGEIQVTGDIGTVFTPASEYAAKVVGYFETTNVDTKVVVEKNKLTIYDADINVPEKDSFDPANCGGRAYCPVCDGDEPVEWTEIKGTGLAAISFANSTQLVNHHYYLSDDASFTASGITFGGNGNVLCLHLNGKTMTAGGIAINSNYGNTINIMGEGTVSGTASSNGGTINVSHKNVVVNIHGGTFKNVEGATGAVIGIGANGGTVNMRGGVIDAEGVTSDKWATAVSIMGAKDVQNGIFNLYDGEIKCGTTSAGYGNIMVGYDDLRAFGAVFNMMGGTVSGGVSTANPYSMFMVRYGGTLNISDGQIYGGNNLGDSYGDNIFVSGTEGYPCTLNITGGEICGDIYTNKYSVVTVSQAPKIVKELTVGDTTYTAKNTGLYIFDGLTVDITDLTADAEVYFDADIDVALTTGTGVTSGIKAYQADKYVEAVEGVVYLRQAKAAIQLGVEEQAFYPTVEEALAAYDGNGYITVHAAGVEIALNGQTVYVDNRGYNVTVTGNGTVYAMDSSNDDYVSAAKWTMAEDATVEFATDVINPINGNRYIVINDNGVRSAHRIQMYLTGISLRPSAAGLYYKAAYKCDSTLAARVEEYGIALRAVEDTTVTNTFDVTPFDPANDSYSVLEGFAKAQDGYTVKSTSTLVYNIFKEGRDPGDNADYGAKKIHATPYIKVDGKYLTANVQDASAAYKAQAGNVHKAMSMQEVLVKMCETELWEGYSEEKKQNLHERYTAWNQWSNGALADWNIDNIKNYTAPAAED